MAWTVNSKPVTEQQTDPNCRPKMRNIFLNGQIRIKRLITTLSEISQSQTISSAKSYREIPRISAVKTMLKMAFGKERKSNIDKVIEEHFKTHGPIVKLCILGKLDTVFVQNPETMQKVFSHDGKFPIEPGFDHFGYYRNKIRKDLFSETAGLLGSHGEDWYEVREKVQQDMMRPKSAMFYINDIEKISFDLSELILQSMDNNQEVEDLLDFINRWSLESITAIFLDMRVNCLRKDLPEDSDEIKFVNAVKVVTGHDGNDIAMGPPLWKYFSTPTFRKFDQASAEIHRISKKLIDETVAEMVEIGSKTEDELSVLQKLIRRCPPNSQIPLVMSQDALMAGVDTTGTTAAFFLLDLARNPDKQKILYQEILNVIGDGCITEKKLNQMKYLKACLHESQRLNPAVFGSSRTTQTDMVIEGYHVPKGVWVSYCIMLAMRDPKQFLEPTKFQPERWLRGCPSHHNAHPFATAIFSHGPRMCIGRRFAELECYILAIKMLQRFKLEYHHEPVAVATEFVNKPDKKIKMRFISRN